MLRPRSVVSLHSSIARESISSIGRIFVRRANEPNDCVAPVRRVVFPRVLICSNRKSRLARAVVVVSVGKSTKSLRNLVKHALAVEGNVVSPVDDTKKMRGVCFLSMRADASRQSQAPYSTTKGLEPPRVALANAPLRPTPLCRGGSRSRTDREKAALAGRSTPVLARRSAPLRPSRHIPFRLGSEEAMRAGCGADRAAHAGHTVFGLTPDLLYHRRFRRQFTLDARRHR